jgi:deazaflavin-dependent oxidoreductase (nitroreductase family)
MPANGRPEGSNMPDFIIDPNNKNWMSEHLQRYLSSHGEDGFYVDFRRIGGPAQVPTLVLTTTGRRSGKPQMLPLIFGHFDGKYVIIASKGGAAEHPAWFLNLEVNPLADIQVKAQKLQVHARVAAGDERLRLWQQMTAFYPAFDKYQARTEREIPVVVLEAA